ncbi:MAG TPA: alpha/beta hydrolase [Sphingomicrobium sp.]|jgi:pimeloyl-ACP methyl ester carboxylesterase|nr:alpha/beta hydrolase [Sphingomicrobium sp.]
MHRILALSLCASCAAAAAWSGPLHAQGLTQSASSAQQRLSRITIRSEGSGKPVVLIPGLASPPSVFDEVAAKIGKDHRLIFVQVNGMASSPAGDAPLDNLIPGAVDELAGWLAANHIEKAAIVGHSMGGLMAMMLAKRHPESAGKLLVVDSLPFYGMLFGPAATPDAIRPMVEQMRAALVSGKAPMQVPPHMSNSDAGKAKILTWLNSSDAKVVGEALVEDSTTDFRPDLAALSGLPITVLYAVPAPENKAMIEGLYSEAYKGLPAAKLVPVADSEHFIMLDQPHRFDEEVEAFLR